MSERAPRRGRPPKSEGADTRVRLLDAAASACADQGFDGATLQEIARRAGVTATAVYNHFDSREALLYAAGVRSLSRMTVAVEGSGPGDFLGVAQAYLRPDMAQTRRLLAELHLASRRDPALAALLEDWHAEVATDLASLLDADPDPLATVKALFLVLLGLCHLEDLDAVQADPDALSERVGAMVEALRRSA
ncbi:MAG: TetR/AcrR family transcriptional regulator [Actinomycetota bacterium]